MRERGQRNDRQHQFRRRPHRRRWPRLRTSPPSGRWKGSASSSPSELAPFGVRVAIVEPGVTRSSIFAKNIDTPNTTGAYAGHYARMFQMYAAGHSHATDAAEVGAVIRHAIETDDPKLRYR